MRRVAFMGDLCRLVGAPVQPRAGPLQPTASPRCGDVYRHGNHVPAISAAGYTELTSGITGTTYTDTAVTVGDAYCYYATAVSSEGLSSVPSNIASNDFRPGVPTSLKETKH